MMPENFIGFINIERDYFENGEMDFDFFAFGEIAICTSPYGEIVGVLLKEEALSIIKESRKAYFKKRTEDSKRRKENGIQKRRYPRRK